MPIFAYEGGEPAGRSILRKAVILYLPSALGDALRPGQVVKRSFCCARLGQFSEKGGGSSGRLFASFL